MSRQQRLRSEVGPRQQLARANRSVASNGVALAARTGSGAALQRAVGNRGVRRLVAPPEPSVEMLQRELVSVEDFQRESSAFGMRPGLLKAIDRALDAFNADRATGFRASGRLRALKRAIDAWLRQPGAMTSRRTPAVSKLAEAVNAELEGRAAFHRAPREGLKKAITSYSQIDGQQFKLAATGGMIETVTRTPSGRYEATGRVVGFNGQVPMIKDYESPRDLGAWQPQVTHLNGMDVAPQEGLMSALALQRAINGEVTGEGVDVLYTYSATRGFAVDVMSCVGAKAGKGGNVTELQTEMMMAAVRNKRRITISAHSRGTIKTDNAVRLAYRRLVQEEVKRGELFILAEMLVKSNMNRYIQLIYAGNAVSYPSNVLKVKMFTAGGDLVSMGVGTYTESGARWASGNPESNLVKTEGGHSFVVNYSQWVGTEIAHDVDTRPRP